MKKLFYIAAMALLVCFTACENETPFDTQSPDDAPQILKPYNESGTGSFTYDLANPDTPLFDSVTVTPSAYTTINWYLDGQKIYTGKKIEMCFPAGTYALRIEAVTNKGLSTYRNGKVVVHPYDADPYSAAPAGGRHAAPEMSVTIDGQNLSKVSEIVISDDLFAKEVRNSVTPATATDAELTFVMPELGDGKYYLRLKDADGKLYGADGIEVHNGSVVLAGFGSFEPGAEWVLTGVNLQNVASVKVDETTITTLTATETSVTLTAPAAEVGEHKLSMLNKDGSSVLFITSEGAVTEAKTIVSDEKTIWTGPNYIQWNENRVRIESSDMAQVPVGVTIIIYYEKLPAGHEGYYENGEYKEYQKMRVMTAWWTDLFPEFDVTDSTPNPYTFTYTQEMKDLVEAQNALSIAGWGLQINKITYK